MGIRRSNESSRNYFDIIDKRTVNDTRLSWEARGLLITLLSFQDDWVVNMKHLATISPNAGRDKLKRILDELEEYGYLTKAYVRQETGSFGEVERTVYEMPIGGYGDQGFWFLSKKHRDGFTVDGKPVNGLPVDGSTVDGKPVDIIKNKSTKKEIVPKNKSTSSAENKFSLEFQEIWGHYPRRLNKAGALSAYSARRKEGVSFEELLKATINYAKVREGEEQTFTLHPTTFFGTKKRYEDYADGALGNVAPMSNVERAIAGFQARQIYIEGEVL